MKFSTLRILALTCMTVAFLAASQCVLAQCSNATVHGHYAFTITGQILAPAPAAGPVTGVAMTEFDGKGNLTQVDHAVHNGAPPQEDWRPGSGTYHVNPDCTGTMTITQHPTVPADASPELELYIVVGDNGNEIRTVVSSSPTVPPFEAAITSIGTKVYAYTW